MRTIRGSWLSSLTLLLALGLATPGSVSAPVTLPAATESPTTRPAVPPLPPVDETPVDIPLEELKLLVKPLDREALNTEAARWMQLLQDKQANVSALRLAARRAEGVERTRLNELAGSLERERNALADRAEVILMSLQRKGGEIQEYQAYLHAVTDADLDTADVSALVTNARTWLLSPEGGIEILLNIVQFLLTLLLAWLLARVLGALTRRALGHVRGATVLLRDFLVGLIRKSIFVVGLVIGLSFLGINIGPLIAAIGAAGLVVGLALQGTLSNFASGIMILLYRPYDVGNVINAAGVSGKVEAMTLVSTTILTFDNQRIIVPNNSIWGDVITNVTGQTLRRVDMTFGISYGDDVDQAEAILRDIVTSHPLVLAEPEPVIRLHQLGESSVNFIVRPWAQTSDYWSVYWDVTKSVKQRFDAQGVTIPFPQRDVHLHREARRTVGDRTAA